jgi:hypothetical protein
MNDVLVPNSPPSCDPGAAVDALTEQLSYLWAWEAAL